MAFSPSSASAQQAGATARSVHVPAEAVADQEVDQQELQESIQSIVQTFNTFHEQMTELKKEQRIVIERIKQSVDQKKIEEIKNMLNQASEY